MKGSKCKKFTDLYRNELFDEQEQKEKVIKREAFEFRRGTKHLCPDEVQKFREKIRSTIVDSVDDVTVDVLDSISLKHVKGNLDFKEEEFSMEVPKINELKKDYVIADRILEKIRKKNKVDVVKPKQYGRQWLMDRLNGCEDMFDPVITVIESNIDIEDSLVNLLGYDRIELVSELVTNRAVILESLKKPNQQLRPLVRTEADVKVNKKLKREMKGKTFKNERYAQLTTELKRETVIEKVLPLKVIPSYPFVFDSRGAFMQHAGASLALPANASHRIRDTFERIHIPAPANRFQSHPVPKIEIAELNDPILSSVFAHSHLNTIQSTVFNAAYNESNVNLLVCAPTGAGKTNVALLAILNIVKKFTRLPVIDKDAFKIVYVAPMKALAAEMTENFSDRLSKLGDIRVRELTGDMQLTKREMQETQLIVTTPEKWDVITRKITGAEGDDSFVRLVKLIIIDEIHLLQDDRGPVIECIVARTLRQVERYQRPIRIVGLSATLPNYIDVAEFLRVNPYKGLFYFDEGFRPVPLDQTYIGINTSTDLLGRQRLFDEICFQEVLAEVRQNNQVIVFVHSRNSTLRTATYLVDQFLRQKLSIISEAMSGERLPSNIQHRALYNLLQHGVGIHHAGMVRSDRMLVEKLFRRSKTRVLVSTATLAWGINLPAHAVLIKGTEIYESKKGAFVDIGILDVLQIFGRAGRPQFDNRGHGIIITTRDKFQSYIQLAMRQNPIESKLLNSLADWLNAEIVLGTVTSVDEAVRWLSDTYFYVRLLSNPQAYGLTLADLSNDPNLALYRRNVVLKTVNALEEAKMVRFDPLNEYLFATDLGRIASHFYIRYETIELINERMDSVLMTDSDVLDLVANASEFRQLKVRDDETAELDRLYEDECEIPLAKAAQATTGDTKAFVLIQAYMSQAEVKTHSLNADINYVSQNAGRILRALFLIAIKRNRALMASRCLLMARAFQQRCWHFFSPLRQLNAPCEMIIKVEQSNLTPDVIMEMSAQELGGIVHQMQMAHHLKRLCTHLPQLDIQVISVQPLTRSVLKISVSLTPAFKWSDAHHGSSSSIFWLWLEDPITDFIYHSQSIVFNKKQVRIEYIQSVSFTIPISEPLPSQYLLRCCSDRFFGTDQTCPVSFQHLILPEYHRPHTELLPLTPLPKTALNNNRFELLYQNFETFNPIQTQLFHCLYHTDSNVLLGAPTGSGKTIVAEIAILRLFTKSPGYKAVYVAPMKALVRERVNDWGKRFKDVLDKQVVELTGDYTPNWKQLQNADIIVTTPEKWDGVSRMWRSREYVGRVALVIIDEIHLLGEDRGPVLEAIVSRANYVTAHRHQTTRLIGLSTAVANAVDLGDWLGIKPHSCGLYNFRSSVRPVPLEAHISGYPGEHYCPRMALMNKPCYHAIRTYSPNKPAIVFVASRRQTRLTALDLVSHLAADGCPKHWLHMPEDELANFTSLIRDPNLHLCLAFGIGLHHAGLCDRDRKIVENLFSECKIQVLVSTATLAWGVNLPAHLVVVKGTEFYDGKTHKYVDYPITDVLQMMGRAGRPQFDTSGVAVIMVQDTKKDFYKKFLYEPFPVESSLLQVLPDHLNAEVATLTVTSVADAIDYLTWTYFFRRLLRNPSYYKLDNLSELNTFLDQLVRSTLDQLVSSGCVERLDDEEITTTVYGAIASYYYLSHETLYLFRTKLVEQMSLTEVLKLVSDAKEFSELPVRHNEDKLCADFANALPLSIQNPDFESPNTKTFLLLQAHFSRSEMPISDFRTDLKSVIDQIYRVLQAALDVSANHAFLNTSLLIVIIMQMTKQAIWIYENELRTMMDETSIEELNLKTLPELAFYVQSRKDSREFLKKHFKVCQVNQIYQRLLQIPLLQLNFDFIDVESNKSCESLVSLSSQKKYLLVCHLTRLFSNLKYDGGWICVLATNDELVALKRFNMGRRQHQKVQVTFTPSTGADKLTFQLMSDTFIGLDQEYEFRIDVH